MGLSLHSKMHQCVTLFPVLFLQSLYVPLNSKNFSIFLYHIAMLQMTSHVCITEVPGVEGMTTYPQLLFVLLHLLLVYLGTHFHPSAHKNFFPCS